MKVGIIGRGFVGNAIFQGLNHYYDLSVYDVDKKKSTHTFEEVIQSDVVFLSVPTPMHKETGDCDLSYIKSVFDQVLDVEDRNKSCTFVIKSTVPVGTTNDLNKKYNEKINIIHSPEFLTARTAVTDFICPSRHIIGGHPARGAHKLQEIYESRFPGVPCFLMSSNESEFVKYFANCFFATKVSFFNEMHAFAEVKGLNWQTVIQGVMSDGRIGISHYQVPGFDGDLGFGGTCFPKDINALIKSFEDSEIDPLLLKAAWERNILVRKNKDWEKSKSAVTE
jgi:nucleotide sugar dehydrogenase